MRLFLDRDDNNWEPHLPSTTMVYNMKVCKATGVTPLLAYFGREAKLPADMVLRLPDTKYQSVLANVQAILEQYQSVFDTIQQQEDETICRSKAAYTEPPRIRWRMQSGIWCLERLARLPRDGLDPGPPPN